MSIFFRREFCSKTVSLLLTLAFLAESTLAPILLFMPQTARAAGSPVVSLSSYNFTAGTSVTVNISGGMPGAEVKVFCRDPNNVVCDDATSYTTNSSGQFSHTYDTTGWTVGNYSGWVTVGGTKSNTVYFAATSAPVNVPATIAISRTPATSATNPYKVGDATAFSSASSPSFFSTDQQITGYNQIGTNTPRTFTASTLALRDNGSCNASTGTCSIPGNWSATDFVCPAGVTGVQQMKEWYTIGNTTSNRLTWYFECSATNIPATRTPVGSLSGVDTSGAATGWAVDPDSSSTPISVHFYVDGAAGAGGTYAGSAVANLASSAANSAGYSGSHGYSFSVPEQWRDGKPHTLYVHGIDLSGDGSKNVLLGGVPKSFTLGTPPDSTEPTLFVSPTVLSAGSQLTISVADAVANGTVKVFCRDPNNVVCDDSVSYTTDVSGRFTHTYDTTGWTAGAYRGWVTVGNVQSNTVNFTVTASTTTTTAPETTLSSYDFAEGTPFTVYVSGVPDGSVSTFCIDPNGTQCQDTSAGVTDASGKFSKIYDTTGWTIGSYTGWATVNGVKSNVVDYAVRAATTTPPVEPPYDGRPTPTPTTAPMATLTLEREQEQVLPNQPVSFSGTLDASRVAFPQGSALFIAVPEKTSIEQIEIDGKALGAGEFTLSGGNAKIPFSQALYNGSHAFRIVLRNEVSLVPQLDRNIAVWVSVVGADGTLLLKGRTTSVMITHVPTEIIGRGVSLSVSRTGWASTGQPILGPGSPTVPGMFLGSDNKMHFPIREFGFGEMDITRGPFFTPNQAPMLPENIALTLLPGDASMQRLAFSLKQFSEPLAKEFITADYQYLLGRNPSQEELSRYLPKFMQWSNPYASLMEVYNRRADVRELVLVPRDKRIGGSNSGSSRPSWDKLLEWAATRGWQEEPSLASFKYQTGFDSGWQPFGELFGKFMSAYVAVQGFLNEGMDTPATFAAALAETNPIAAIANLCAMSNSTHNHFSKLLGDPIDFEFCWKNDPMVRNYAILWAKDQGWAYNSIVTDVWQTAESYSYPTPVVVTINPNGPILAPMFGPGKYSEYAQESAMRYPPAQLYYDLVSSSEYAQSIEQRFRKNIDSVVRLFFGRAANESDILWAKDKFISGGIKKSLGYHQARSWITPQWEPNGALIASNFNYIDEVEFVKNPRFITDDIYGIRHIQVEVDTVSSRLIEMIEKHGRQELYQGDNFKRIVSGLYRLYLRRDPTDAELEKHRASGKSFGDIEFKLNQSSEYGDKPASPEAIRSLYRNYLGRDPSDADVASWGDKTISSIANKIGKSAEMKSIAQQHPENAYIFPVKEIKIKKCGFFCSIMGRIIGIALSVVSYAFPPLLPLSIGYFAAGVSQGSLDSTLGTSFGVSYHVTNIMMGSISRSFSKAGFNGETFVSYASVARSMAGQAGGVFSMTNLMENADPTILDGFRTMAIAPQASGSAFAQAGQPYLGLASPLGAITGLFSSDNQTASAGRIAQIDVSGHYGSGVVVPAKSSTGTTKSATAKAQFTKTLAQGSRGAEVLKLQKLLGETDLVFLPEYQTGYYGAKTVAAVKRFQKRNGLEQVGFVGAKTRALLNSAR